MYPITDKGWKKKLNRGAGPRYWVPLPMLEGGFWVADLRIELSVEKGWLADQERQIPFDEDGRRAFAARLSWLRDRPAYSKEFNLSIYFPLEAAMDSLLDEGSTTGAAATSQLVEICVRVDGDIKPSTAQLFVLTNSSPDPALRERFEDLRDQLRVEASAVGIDLLALDVRSVDDLSDHDPDPGLHPSRASLSGAATTSSASMSRFLSST